MFVTRWSAARSPQALVAVHAAGRLRASATYLYKNRQRIIIIKRNQEPSYGKKRKEKKRKERKKAQALLLAFTTRERLPDEEGTNERPRVADRLSRRQRARHQAQRATSTSTRATWRPLRNTHTSNSAVVSFQTKKEKRREKKREKKKERKKKGHLEEAEEIAARFRVRGGEVRAEGHHL